MVKRFMGAAQSRWALAKVKQKALVVIAQLANIQTPQILD